MTTPAVRSEVNGRIAHLVFDRPDALNAFNTELMNATTAAMQEFEADERVLAIVVSGSGRCFSAGFDMKEAAQRATVGENAWRHVLTEDFDFIVQFWSCTKPTLAAVHGYCLGGAFELMLACDLSVAGQSALLGEPEVTFGSGIVAMLAPWITGPKQAKELLLTGNGRVSAQRCYDMGVLNRVVPDGQELDAAMELARQIAAAAPRSVALTKRAVNAAYEIGRFREALIAGLEIDVSIESDMSPERQEFNRIRRELGLKAALAWRDGRSV